jgi:hypothetical protein
VRTPFFLSPLFPIAGSEPRVSASAERFFFHEKNLSRVFLFIISVEKKESNSIIAAICPEFGILLCHVIKKYDVNFYVPAGLHPRACCSSRASMREEISAEDSSVHAAQLFDTFVLVFMPQLVSIIE